MIRRSVDGLVGHCSGLNAIGAVGFGAFYAYSDYSKNAHTHTHIDIDQCYNIPNHRNFFGKSSRESLGNATRLIANEFSSVLSITFEFNLFSFRV